MASATKPGRLESRWKTSIEDYVVAALWSPRQHLIAAAGIGGAIFLLNPADGSVLRKLSGHEFGASSLSWHAEGSLLASCGQDGQARIWNADTGACLHELALGASWGEKVLFHPKSDLLLTTAGKKIKLWNSQGQLLQSFQDSKTTIADVVWAPKGKGFASATYGGVTLWNEDSPEPALTYPWKGSLLVIAWSPDSKMIAGGAQDASVHFWYTKDGRDLEMTGYPIKIRELSWEAKSSLLATGGGQIVTIWDCTGKGPAGSEPISLEYHELPISVLAFQNRGPRLVSGCNGGKLALWEPRAASRTLATLELSSKITALSWGKSDEKILVGCEDGSISLLLT
ncbi:WD40 repeat domain-containing protein [Telmatocola sphagniphila]|uniref:WD40 repeat domain-containing protein n=1 Tax=Telmatocola sphagniphila TaxID=1123043 RepID=A0A8E6B8B1_9BACT|nr:WD40 repeat domain-containing protein [Telmatocola sphagniphila]QVL32255.1 WD40 repeat domain-containing protein [Telmatocola sphagniphila]